MNKESKKRCGLIRWIRRQLQNRFLVLALVGLLMALLMVGLYFINRAAEQDVPEELHLSVAVTQLPDILDPAQNSNSEKETVMLHLFENLLREDVDREGNIILIPAQAASYTEEEIYDGTVRYVFHLRRDAVWSDGVPVKAEDFVRSWRRLSDPKHGFAASSFYVDMVQGYQEVQETGDVSKLAVTALDDYTLEIILSSRCPYFLQDICTAAVTMPLRGDMGTGWMQNMGQLLTNGAYTLADWQPGEGMYLLKNQNYYSAESVGPDSLRFTRYDDVESAYAAYTEGSVDYTLRLPNALLKDYVADNQGETGSDWTVDTLLSNYVVLFNHQTEGFNDPRVRQAFSQAIDRNALVSSLGGGKIAATGLVPYGVEDDAGEADFRTVGGDFYGTTSADYTMLREEAQLLMHQAGYPKGEDFPEVEYWYLNTAENEIVARQLQNMWKNVLGITVELKAIDEVNWSDALELDAFTIMGYEMSSPYNDALYFLQPWMSQGAENWMHYANHIFDLLISASINFTMEGAHSVYLHEAEQLLMDDYALAPLYYNSNSYAQREGLTGVYHDLEGRYYFSSVQRTNGK